MRWCTLYFLGLLLVFSSCIQYPQNKDIFYEVEFEFNLPDSISFLHLINQSSEILEKSYWKAYYQQILTKNIYEITVDEEGLSAILSKLKLDSYFFNTVIQSADSIFSFENNISALLLGDANNSRVKSFEIDQKYTPVIDPSSFRLVRSGSTFLIGNTSKVIDIGSKEGRLAYYNEIKPIISFNISNDLNSISEIGHFPDHYRISGNFYNDIVPSSCFTDRGLICLSFFADDRLYLYKDTSLVSSKVVSSNFIGKFSPIPDEKRNDMHYLKKYIIEEPRYTSVKYDPYNRMFYRIVKHRSEYRNVKHNEYQHWSVVVADSNLNVMGEAKFTTEYDMNSFHPTPFGIALIRHNNSDEMNSTFVIIKLIY
jgi:hypothetical protein